MAELIDGVYLNKYLAPQLLKEFKNYKDEKLTNKRNCNYLAKKNTDLKNKISKNYFFSKCSSISAI